MELTCLLTILSLVACGYLLAELNSKKIFTISDGKLSCNNLTKRDILILCITVILFLTGIGFCIADISKNFNDEPSFISIFAIVIVFMMNVLGFTSLGKAIRTPDQVLDINIFSLNWNKTINRCINIILLLIWIIIAICLYNLGETFNCIVFAATGGITLLLTTVIFIIIGIIAIILLLVYEGYKALRKTLSKH